MKPSFAGHPSAGALTTLLEVNAARGARRLQVGEHCTIAIPAREAWVPTIFVEPGEEYLMTATGWWFDGKHSCGPDGHRSRTLWMRMLKRFRRVRTARWFALIGSVGKDDDQPFVIGSSAQVRITKLGLLLCYGNHVRGFYRGKHGRVTVTIHRAK